VPRSLALTFIRNGSEHDGPAAAKHLRRKLDYAGERMQTAEQFIQHCAAESSLTRRKYKVRTAQGQTIDAATYLTGQLRDFEQQKR